LILFQTQDLAFNNLIYYPDMEIPKKCVTFIAGESGSGKSTLLRLLNGTLTQSHGDIFYEGKNILDIHSIHLRREVLLIGQSVFLFDKTIRENFKMFYDYREEQVPDDEVQHHFLHLCRIAFDLDKSCTTMSGGERQRVYLAIYLSFQPPVILFDEPTAALDTENSHSVMRNIIEFSKEKGITLIVVSHDNSLAETFAEKTIFLKKGW
jgi:putative ABC transport system ATP-binding protein